MAIKIKRTQNVSKSYYELNDKALSNGKEAGSKSRSKESSEIFKKITKYSHNILKSTKNLAFDIVDSQIPNLKDIREQINETAAETTEEARGAMSDIVAFGKKKLNSSGKPIKEVAGEAIKKQKDDILKRLKSGKIYMSDAEREEERFNAEYGFEDNDDFNFDSDFGDMGDTFVSVAEDDSLPDEPFSAPVRKGMVHYKNVSAERRQKLSKSNVKHVSKSNSHRSSSTTRVGELRLGDELVSETASQVGQSILEQNEELWARSFAAEETRFGKLIGYQSTIVSSLNNIIEFNNNVVGENIRAQMEYQAKAIAAQEDLLGLTKELKDTMIAIGTYNPNTINTKSVLDGNRLNAKNYSEIIKSNIGDKLSASGLGGIGMMLGMIPMLTENGDVVKGSIDPMNIALKFLGNSLLSNKTRAKAFNINKKMNNFGASFLNRMNELAQDGGDVGRFIGSILGDRSTKITQVNLGLKDPNHVVGWTSKSDRTLNSVIPALLSKLLNVETQIAVGAHGLTIDGDSEISYDYSVGKFITKKAFKNKAKEERNLAYRNATIDSYTSRMIDFASSNSKDSAFITKNREKIEEAMDKINQNIVKEKVPLRLHKIQSTETEYAKKILSGVNKKYAKIALGILSDGFAAMTGDERETLNGVGYGSASRQVQKRLNELSNRAMETGGDVFLSEVASGDDIESIAKDILESRKFNIKSNKNKESDYDLTNRMFDRANEIIKLAELITSDPDSKRNKAVKDLLKAEGVDDVDALLKKAVKLKKAASIQSHNQQMRRDVLSMSLPNVILGARTNDNPVDKAFGHVFDAIGGTYSNFMGNNEASGSGLMDETSIEHLMRDADDTTKRRLDELYMKTPNIFGGALKEKMHDFVQRSYNNIDEAEKQFSTPRGANKFEFQNFDKINNRYVRGFANGGLDLWNKHIYNTNITAENDMKTAFTSTFGDIKSSFSKKSKEELNKFINSHPALISFLSEKYGMAKTLTNASPEQLKNWWNIFSKQLKTPKAYNNLKNHVFEWLKTTKAGNAVFKSKQGFSEISSIFSTTIDSFKNGFNNGDSYEQHFAEGGIISGYDDGEDKVDVKAKPGEMILTKDQQAKLYNLVENGGRSIKGALDSVGVAYRDVADSIKENGVDGTMKIYAEQIKQQPLVKNFIKRVNEVIGKSRNVLGGYGDVISLGSKRRGLARGIGIAGAALGGVAGSVFGGHPLLGATIGGTAFKKIGNLFKMKYPTLKGSLLAAGYSDAPKMNKKDLYALITNMALSKDKYESQKGKSLITTDEFAQLESDVTTKNGFDKFIDKVKAVPKFFKNRALDIKLFLHRTLKYKSLVNVLNNRFNSGPGGFDVTSYDKESLYALVQSLPDKTKADKQFKATIMGMKEYKKLDKDIANYMTLGDSIREGVKDIPKKIVRAFRYGRLLPYRNIAKIYMNKENMDEKEFLNMTKDPNDLYLHLLSWEGTKDKGNIFRILKKQKSFMKLEIAAAKIQGKNEGLSKDEIKDKVDAIKSSFKQRKRFEGVAQILKSANRSKNPPDYENMEPSDLYAAATALIEKGGKLGKALAASGQYKLLETTIKGKTNAPTGTMNKLKGWINRKFGTNFKIKEKTGPDFGDSSDWSDMTNSGTKHQQKLKAYMRFLRKKGIRGSKAKRLINDWMSRNNVFAGGGINDDNGVSIVNGPEYGDKNAALLNGGEMIIPKKDQIGFFNWIKSFGAGGNTTAKENAKFANKALSKNQLKLSKIIDGEGDQVAKKIITIGGPFAGMISLLSQMNKTLASTLKVIGGNDKGEIDQNNVETIAGQINNIEGGGDGDGKSGKGGGKWNWLKKNGGTLAKTSFYGLGTAAMAALSGRSLIKKIGRVKEDGIDGLLERESGTAFNADGSRKTGLQLALDRGGDASNRAIAQSVIQKVGMTAVEKSAGKTVGGFMGAARGFKTNAKKLLSSIGTSATDAATKNADDLLTKNLKGIEDTLLKFLKDPKIIKKLPKAAVGSLSKLTNFVKEIPKRIAQFAKNGIKNSAKSASNALKAVPMAGWIMAIASVVWDVANSLNDAPKYFHVAPKDVTGGMRATAGIVGGIKSLIVNLLSVTGVGAIIGVAIDMVIPTDWMVENVYKLIGGETARQELAEKQQKQKDVAASLGVDSDKLTEAQNNSLLSKGLNGIKALFSKKTYAELQEETALKKLNKGRTDGNKITAEQYRQATGSAAPMSESDKASARSDKDVETAISKIKSLNVGTAKLKEFNEIASIYERVLKSGNIEGAVKIIEEAKKKESNKSIGAFPSDTSVLTDAFSKKWANLLNDTEVQAAGITNPTVSSTKRPLATQMALYAKGRSSYEMLDAVVKAAGISQGAGFWGGDPTKGTVTQTLKSDHLGGNALDVTLSDNKLAVLGKKAKQYGIEWGGDWPGGWDKPHFQDAAPTQFAALGGIVKGFGSSTKFGDRIKMGLNPGEMVLNKVQQTSLFNMINKFARDTYGDGKAHAMARLNESPLITNAKADIKMIQDALNIQQAIYAEQRRHNDVAEKFFNAILKLMAGSNQPIPTKIISNEREDVSELLNGAARIATSF